MLEILMNVLVDTPERSLNSLIDHKTMFKWPREFKPERHLDADKERDIERLYIIFRLNSMLNLEYIFKIVSS
jgi:hypothetical protein